MSKLKRSAIHVFGPVAILGGGALATWLLLWTAPQTQPDEPVRASRIVQTMPIAPKSERVVVAAQGPVIPARTIVVRPEVRGRVVQHHPALVPGGYVAEGEPLIRIDPSDYQLALNEQIAASEEAKFELELERGRQVIASREWQLLEQELDDIEVNRALVLREPHLRRIEAMLRKATNEIAKAQLNIARTSITAPFNATVLEESIEMGQLVEPGSAICTLVGTDEFWVQATVPLHQLNRIRFPTADQPGAAARVILDTGNGQSEIWNGTVARLLSDLDPDGRMARILITVRDPLGLENRDEHRPLLLGSYVRVEIDAGELHDVLAIPRAALREGNRIWIVNAQNELEIHDVDVFWSQKESLLVSNGLKPGDQLVVSGLRVALPGMKVEPHPIAGQEAQP